MVAVSGPLLARVYGEPLLTGMPRGGEEALLARNGLVADDVARPFRSARRLLPVDEGGMTIGPPAYLLLAATFLTARTKPR